jgi:hypothetical protein
MLKSKDETMKPKLGQKYSRQEISEMMGGSPQHYLPFKDGEILCGCFNPSREYNPGAPELVLFGSSKNRIVEDTAEMVYRQSTPIPIFIFRSSAQWKYIGDYRCVGYSCDSILMKEMMKEYPERGEIVGLLRFKKA